MALPLLGMAKLPPREFSRIFCIVASDFHKDPRVCLNARGSVRQSLKNPSGGRYMKAESEVCMHRARARAMRSLVAAVRHFAELELHSSSALAAPVVGQRGMAPGLRT